MFDFLAGLVEHHLVLNPKLLNTEPWRPQRTQPVALKAVNNNGIKFGIEGNERVLLTV